MGKIKGITNRTDGSKPSVKGVISKRKSLKIFKGDIKCERESNSLGKLWTPDTKLISNVKRSVSCMFALYKQKPEEKSSLLLPGPDRRDRISLQFTSIKLYPNIKSLFKVMLPNPINMGDDMDVCLVIRQPKGCTDADEASQLMKEALARQNIRIITEVLTVKHLRTEYRTYESKRRLFKLYDVILVQEEVIRQMPLLLGREFYSHARYPISMRLHAEKDYEKQIKRALAMTYLPISSRGNCCMMNVGLHSQTEEQVTDNILECLRRIIGRFPGSWENVKSIHLKSDAVDQSIPIYVSLANPNSVNICPAEDPEEDEFEEVGSLLLNKLARVSRTGEIEFRSISQ